MRLRLALWVGVAATAAVVFANVMPVSGQAARAGEAGAGAAASSPARTPWGHPDLQGTWTNFSSVNTALPAFGGKRSQLLGGTGDCIPAGVTPQQRGAQIGAGPEHWYETQRGTPGGAPRGLIVEPSDGRLPPFTKAADQRVDAICRQIFDSYVYLDPWVRCISRGIPASMFPSAYNNAYRILQTKEYVAIFYEMIHEARIIPLDTRPATGQDIRLWMGSSRGRWEGDTLVVEATNFHDRGAIRGHPHSDALRVVERFTRKGPGTMGYQVTVEDLKTWTAPFKVAIDLTRDDEYQMFEYACHEGNLAVENILSGARLEEQEAR
jgi:hypothetical protein